MKIAPCPERIRQTNVTTVILGPAQAESTPSVSISGWVDYDEYGLSKTGHDAGVGYGWLGKHERSTSIESAGLTLMGVRLYNPVRGGFTSTDPVFGGNTTAYTYPQDPVNDFDLEGKISLKKRAENFISKKIKQFKSALRKGWDSKLTRNLAKSIVGTSWGRYALRVCGYLKSAISLSCSIIGTLATWRHQGAAAARRYIKSEIFGRISTGQFARGLNKLAGGGSTPLARRFFEMSGQLHWDALQTVRANA